MAFLAQNLVSHTVRSQLTASLTDQNMVMSDTTALSASLLGGSIAMDDLVVTDVSGEEARTPYKSDELRLDIATLATLFGGDYTIERLASNGTEFDFRRRPDGSIPGIPPEIDPTHQPGSSEQAPETDLISLAQSLHKRWEQIREYDWVLDKIPSGSEEERSQQLTGTKRFIIRRLQLPLPSRTHLLASLFENSIFRRWHSASKYRWNKSRYKRPRHSKLLILRTKRIPHAL